MPRTLSTSGCFMRPMNWRAYAESDSTNRLWPSLARIRRERLHESPLAFLEHRIKSQTRRLARTRNTGHHHDGIAGNGKVHMAEVMFVRIADFNRLSHAAQYRKRRPRRLIFSEQMCRIPSGSVGPGRTLGSKLRKSCENDPLALLGQAV